VRPSRAPDADDLFAASVPEPKAPELPEPPALFLSPATPAEAGEVRPPSDSRPKVSLEPREFPPPDVEEATAEAATPAAPTTPAVPAAPFGAAEPLVAPAVPSASPFVAARVEGATPEEATTPEEAAAAVVAEPAVPATPAVPAAPSVAAEPLVAAPAVPATPPSVAAEPLVETAAEPEAAEPTGRALADLYYAQGHYAEALQIYDDLVTRHPFDDDLKRMRRDAEARLLPAASTPSAAAADPGLERRLSRVRVLKQWLGRIQGPDHSASASAPPGAPGP
jgi:hypothetical protein